MIISESRYGLVWYPNICNLSHWCRQAHICVGNLTTIGSDNGLSPGRRQAIIWTNAGLLLTGPLGIYLSETWIKIQQFSLRKWSSGKCRLSCLGLNVLNKRCVCYLSQSTSNHVGISGIRRRVLVTKSINITDYKTDEPSRRDEQYDGFLDI